MGSEHANIHIEQVDMTKEVHLEIPDLKKKKRNIPENDCNSRKFYNMDQQTSDPYMCICKSVVKLTDQIIHEQTRDHREKSYHYMYVEKN